jgi:hypothetical protein
MLPKETALQATATQPGGLNEVPSAPAIAGVWLLGKPDSQLTSPYSLSFAHETGSANEFGRIDSCGDAAHVIETAIQPKNPAVSADNALIEHGTGAEWLPMNVWAQGLLTPDLDQPAPCSFHRMAECESLHLRLPLAENTRFNHRE